jgi:hypothetical protein
LKDRRRMKVASCRPKYVDGKDNELTQVSLSVKNKITKPVSKFLLFWEWEEAGSCCSSALK